MKNPLNKTHTITSYNINYNGLIIAGADQYILADKSIILEIFPFAGLEAAGLKLAPEQQWKDYRTIEPNALSGLATDQVKSMIATMINNYSAIGESITITLRKEVFEIIIEKNGRKRDLIMVYGYEKFAADQDKFSPAIYVQDREEFDTWRFDIKDAEELIYQTIFPELKALRPRKKEGA